jgi:hypothetical protein
VRGFEVDSARTLAEISAPALLLLPTRSKMGATLQLELAGPALRDRFTQRELALPHTMGWEPGKLTVLEDGVEIEFRPKRRP